MGDYMVDKDELISGMTYTYKCMINSSENSGVDITSHLEITKNDRYIHSDYTIIPFSEREAIKLRDYLLSVYPIEVTA